MEERLFQGMDYVYAVYQEGSFLKAAQKLFISQPSISASVRRVEERLGCQLFDRSVKPLRMTECGVRYIEAIEKIYALERDFSEYVNDWGGLRMGTLILGGSSLFSSLVLPPKIAAFNKKYPQVSVSLVEETTANLEEQLQKGSVDLVVDYEIPNSENYDSKMLEAEYMMLAVPEKFKANKGLEAYQVNLEHLNQSAEEYPEAVPLEAFKDEPFILQKPENDSRKRADEMCAEHHFVPKVILEFDQQMTTYLASCSGMGICFVSSTLVSRISPSPSMVYYRLGGELSRRQICIFWKHGRYMTRAVEEFLNMYTQL